MPKQKITREMISDAAFEYAKKNGIDKIHVKKIGELLNCSVQPIYSYYKDLDDLKKEVINRTKHYLNEYIQKNMEENNVFKSVGIAYAKFAKDEPNLYRLYFLREREHMTSIDEIYKNEASPMIAESIAKDLDISLEKAKELHLNMMIYTVGVSFILTSLGENTDIEEVSKLLIHAHDTFIKGGV